MNNTILALIVSIILSGILGIIQIAYDSKIYNIKGYLTLAFFIYLLIMTIGNIFVTLITASIFENIDISDIGNSSLGKINTMLLQGPRWLWYSGIGVFGFQALIQKVNITIFDAGILAINEWIEKAKNSATASILERYADINIENIRRLANQLVDKFNIEEIHTLSSIHLGNDIYMEITDQAKKNSNLNLELYLANILADEVPKVIKAELKTKKNR